MSTAREHLAAAARLYGPTASELHNTLIAGADRLRDMAKTLNPKSSGAEARVAELLAQTHGLQRTALRLRELIGREHGHP